MNMAEIMLLISFICVSFGAKLKTSHLRSSALQKLR